MCRACDQGGRRCPKTERTKTNERAAAKRYYLRTKARTIIAALRSDGVPAVDDLHFPGMWHLGKHLDLAAPPARRSQGMNKPLGLWTSPGRPTSDGGVQVAWTDWEVRQGHNPHQGGRTLFPVAPLPGSVIIRLNTAADVRAFGRRFPEFIDQGDDKKAAWQAVRQVASGVFVTEQGVQAAKGIYYGDRRRRHEANGDPEWAAADTLENWDTSSAVWFDNTLIETTGATTLGAYPEAEQDEDGWMTATHELGEDGFTFNE